MNDSEATLSASPVDVVFTLSVETWDDVVDRGHARPPDRLLQQVADHPSTGSLTIVNAPRSVLSLLRGRTGRRSPPPERSLPTEIWTPWRLRRRDPLRPPDLEKTYRRYADRLWRHLDRRSVRTPLLITASPLLAGYMPHDGFLRVVLLARDDAAAHHAQRPWWSAYHEAYRRLVEQRTTVVAVSRVLLDRIDPTGQCRGYVAPNGVDAGEWRELPPAPPWLQRLPRPLLLYLGGLDERLDVDVLDEVAKQCPNASILLAGPLLDPPHLEALLANPNVHHRLLRSRREVVAVAGHADACLLAHRTTRLTQAMSPLKLYEYLASGSPVVSVDLEPIHDGISDHLFLCTERSCWPQAVGKALALGRMTEHERQTFISQNSWEMRYQPLLSQLLAGV